MTAPDEFVALQRRVSALEAEHFAIVEQMRRVRDSAERNANALDDLEEVLTDVSVATAENTEAMAAAMSQRQAQLDLDDADMGNPDLGAMLPASPGELVPFPAPGGGPHPGAPDGGQAGPGVEMPELMVLHSWVEDHIAPMARKTTTTGEGGGIRWCRMWWEHHDAVERFIALYLTWQELSTTEESATWLSVFLRDHLDPHMATLTSPYGPFYDCNPHRHSPAVEALGHLPLSHDTAPHPPSPVPTRTRT